MDKELYSLSLSHIYDDFYNTAERLFKKCLRRYMMPKLKGYPVSSGYKGQLPDGSWQIFDTEGEYINYILELEGYNDSKRETEGTNESER